MPEDTIPLRRFFEAVEERLSACSADELRSILRAMAQVVAPKDRQGFLEALVPGKEARDVIQSALRQDDLLSEIDDLVAEIRAEMDSAEDAYDRYGGHWDDEDSLGPYEQFIAPLAELFDRTAGVFDCDNRSLARDAYRKLFDGLAMEDDYGRGVRASDLRDADIRARAAVTCVPSTRSKRPPTGRSGCSKRCRISETSWETGRSCWRT